MLKKIFTILFLTIFSFAYSHHCPVLGIGAPCMDILMNVDDQFLASLGKKGWSQQTDQFFVQKIIEQTKIQKSYIATGGSCSNTIKGLTNLGHSCAFFGKIGKDEMGSQYYKSIKKAGIFPLCLQSDSPTQVCMCLVSNDGERTMRCCPGAANEISAEEIDPNNFKGVRLVHIEGYMLYSKDGNFIPSAMKCAKESGALISFDLSSYDLIRLQKEKIMDLLKNYVDIVFANEEEVKELTGMDPVEGCQFLKEICPVAVVMLGANGCLVGSKKDIYYSPAFPVKVVDTTGAGDLFASGFLHGYLNGLHLKACALMGNMVGGAVCEVFGAEIPEKKWDQIRMQLACFDS